MSQVTDQNTLVAQYEAIVDMDQAALDVAHLNLDYAHIRAPVRGILGVRLLDAGNIIRSAEPNGLVLITTVDPIAAIFSLPQGDLKAIQQAFARQPRLPAMAFTDNPNQPLASGECYLLDNQINAATGSLRFKGAICQPQSFIVAQSIY